MRTYDPEARFARRRAKALVSVTKAILAVFVLFLIVAGPLLSR